MTYVQYINCNKWKKVIGISLWIGASIGLGYLTFCAVEQYGTTNNGLTELKLIKSNPPTSDNPFGSNEYQDQPAYVVETFFLIVAGLGNFANYFMIWRSLNNHYQWLEIKCGVKPKTDDLK